MDYRIPMNRLSIQLRLADGSEKNADIFLHTVSDSHSGPETVDEFLNGPRSFIPCLLTESSDPYLCNKEMILSVEGVEDGEVILRDAGSEPTAVHRVRIGLAGGRRFEGDLQVWLPAESCRVSDFLNAADQFFPVHREDGTVTYVHRKFVEDVVPLQEASRTS